MKEEKRTSSAGMATPLILARACQNDPVVRLNRDAQNAAKPLWASHDNSKINPRRLSEEAVI